MLLQVRVDAGDGHADAPVTIRTVRRTEPWHDQNGSTAAHAVMRAQLPHGEDHEAECQQVRQNRHRPDANSSLSTSTSVVTRVTSRPPGCGHRSDVQLLQVGHQLPARSNMLWAMYCMMYIWANSNRRYEQGREYSDTCVIPVSARRIAAVDGV